MNDMTEAASALKTLVDARQNNRLLRMFYPDTLVAVETSHAY